MERGIIFAILLISINVLFVNCQNPTPDSTKETDVCKDLEKDTCCKTTNCDFFTCKSMVDGKETDHNECHAASWAGDDVCVNGTENATCTPAPVTTAKPEPVTDAGTTKASAPETGCAQYNDNQTSCCANTSCSYITCDDVKDETKKINQCYEATTNFSAICANVTNINQCQEVTTPKPSTAKPSTQAPVTDVCESYKTSEDCCSHSDDEKCQYINCTTADGTKHNGCHVVDTDLSDVCKTDKTDLCTEATTKTPDVTTKTPAPTSSETPDKKANTDNTERGQHFDGASFIGGIVLCAGIVAIIFFGLKFYRAKTERNYHTL